MGAAEYCAGVLVRYVVAAATDRGAKAVNADFGPLFGLKDGAGLTADGGGRAGSEAGGCAVEDFRPGGAGYDMMNVCSWRNRLLVHLNVPGGLFWASDKYLLYPSFL